MDSEKYWLRMRLAGIIKSKIGLFYLATSITDSLNYLIAWYTINWSFIVSATETDRLADQSFSIKSEDWVF